MYARMQLNLNTCIFKILPACIITCFHTHLHALCINAFKSRMSTRINKHTHMCTYAHQQTHAYVHICAHSKSDTLQENFTNHLFFCVYVCMCVCF